MTVRDMPKTCIFAGFPLNPADNNRKNTIWLEQKLNDPSSHFILYSEGRPLMDVSQGLHPCLKFADELKDITGGDWGAVDWVFIGLEGDDAFFAVSLSREIDLGNHEKFIDLRSIALQLSAGGFSDIPALLGRGKMLLDWNGRRHYCSCCGGRTAPRNGGYIRKCLNDDCGAEHFPRTDPVVIMLVTKGDRCLLGRGKGWPEGRYSALAGFMEPGETIEEAVRREVLEEAGIRIGDVRYIKSQPWPFPSSLMIGVEAEALSADIALDDELDEAAWFDRDYLQTVFENGGDEKFSIPISIAIARHLLQDWVFRK